jgi:hypothetical protein
VLSDKPIKSANADVSGGGKSYVSSNRVEQAKTELSLGPAMSPKLFVCTTAKDGLAFLSFPYAL